MSIASSLHYSADINNIRENYDTSNPVLQQIIKVKEQRLKILQELNKQQQEEFSSLRLPITENPRPRSKGSSIKSRKSETSFPQISIRRSARIQNAPSVTYKEDSIQFREETVTPTKTPITRPPNDYGPIAGVKIGQHWETRMECSLYGVHRPTVAGIHGGPNGAYSIALSGGYPEDIDEGETFLYTGAGGRDLKGTTMKPKNLRIAPQTKDQQLEGTNLSLVKSIKSKLPIRVIRGYKSPSIFAPETGYRYDGLYQVVEYWEDVGKTGYRIYRFKMERMKDQDPPPWGRLENKRIKQKMVYQRKDDSEKDNLVLLENETEFKENISPVEYEGGQILYRDVSLKEVKDVDQEIDICINFFCKAASIKNYDSLKNNYEEGDFSGWDSL